MASDLSPVMLDKLRKHFETGVPIERMTFTPDQKKRIQMCIEGYNRLATDPFMNIRAYLRNRFNRTYSELKNDIKLIDYISSFFEEGQKNISKLQVRHASRTLMKNGSETGNMKALHDGASLLIKLDKLDQPDAPEEMSEDMARMPIVVTTNVGDKFANKRGRSEEEMRRIRKKWGVSIDQWQAAMEEGEGIEEAQLVEEENANDAKDDAEEIIGRFPGVVGNEGLAAELVLKQEADAEAKAELDAEADAEMLEARASELEEESDEDGEKSPSDGDESPSDDDDDWDAEIDAIIAADEKAHEERVKKNK